MASIANRAALPVDAVLPDVIAALRHHGAVVLRAPTGAGKTTRVPPALLESGLVDKGRIFLVEPRRLPARAAARRMSQENGSRLGDEIGYHVRFDRKYSPQTRVLSLTPGVLLRHLLDEPYLESIGVLIFDEFHERGLDNDLALGIARLVQQTVRPELRIVVMSATLATKPLAAYLGGCPVIEAEGRQYPVEIRYEPIPRVEPWPVAVRRAATTLLEQTSGDILIFLPGMREIRQTAKHLTPLADATNLLVVPLHGDLSTDKQDAALLRQTRRRIVLTTNVAETSVTVEGITGVVDAGLARILTFDPTVGLDRLRLMRISKASADQRAGRAGRIQPGVCIRLWSEAEHRGRPDNTEPEIRRIDLAGAVLQLLCLGEAELPRFPWLEAPRGTSVAQAMGLLQRLDAVSNGQVTKLGRMMARLPAHPRIARLLLAGAHWGDPARVALAAALLSERDPFVRDSNTRQARTPPATTPSDVLDRVEALEAWERHKITNTAVGLVHQNAAQFVLHARDQFLQLLPQEQRRAGTSQKAPISDDALLRSMLKAFPDRVARRRDRGSRRGVMVGGRGVLLAETSGVRDAELFLCVDIDAGETEAVVRLASAIERDWLPSGRMRKETTVYFDTVSEKVAARQRALYDDLVIEESPAQLPKSDEVSRILAVAAAEYFEQVQPPPESAFQAYVTRLRCLREWLPELALPEFGETELRELVAPLCHGRRSFAELRAADWLGAMQGRLTYTQLQAIAREAPERLLVPSGSRVAVRYERGRFPVLAVRLQELFGLHQTPRIAAGRIPLVLHLLAPNFRPQQVTDDLGSFWRNIYPQIRKELRAHYPKHAWPEDPLAAVPQRVPRRQKGKDS